MAGVTQEHRANDPEGYERTRRLFSTLNRYAKPVGKKDIIALDEDDSVAIVTRLLVEDHPLFVGKISLGQSKNIAQADQKSFTSIVALYDCLDTYLQEEPIRSWNKFKKSRPDDRKLEELRKKAELLFDTFCGYFPELMEIRNSSQDAQTAAKHRHKNGGHLLFRPIGLLASVCVVRGLIDWHDVSVEDAVSQVAQVPMQLDHEMWRGLLWNASLKRMITAPENQKAATKRLFFAAGGDLAHFKTSEESLKSELAGLLNREKEEILLECFV